MKIMLNDWFVVGNKTQTATQIFSSQRFIIALAQARVYLNAMCCVSMAFSLTVIYAWKF